MPHRFIDPAVKDLITINRFSKKYMPAILWDHLKAEIRLRDLKIFKYGWWWYRLNATFNKMYYVFKSFVLFHASRSYPANTLKYLNREDTKHTFVYFTDFEVIPAELNAIKQILNKQNSTRPIYTFIALRTIILQSVHGVNKSLSFIIKHADICSYHRKNTWNTSLPAHNGILNKTCQFFLF